MLPRDFDTLCRNASTTHIDATTGGVPYFASALSGLAAYSASRARLVAMLKPCPGSFLTNCHRLRKPAASMKFASSISSIIILLGYLLYWGGD